MNVVVVYWILVLATSWKEEEYTAVCIGKNMKYEFCSSILHPGSYVMKGRRVYCGMYWEEYEV